jgi:Fe2+/Zn2+ uptake regulation proteins
MNRPSSYNTKQREAVLEYIVSLGNTHITAAQVVGYFENEEAPVGRTTVYRNLEKLVQEGKLHKYNVDGIIGACYQYVNVSDGQQQHLLLKCEECGELIHLNCEVLDEIHLHIYQDHTFKVNPTKTVFYGKCEDCFSNK